jgi:UDP-glucose 6-dehydrogenase
MRESRVIPIVNQLLSEGAAVTAYDPIASNVAETIFGEKVSYASQQMTV